MGNLSIDTRFGPGFQFKISTAVINNLFEIILGKNTISVDVTHNTMKSSGFPVEMTSTQLEGAIPHLTEAVGDDKNLNARFMNYGAPRFIFSESHMSVTYSLLVDLYDESYQEKVASILFNDVTISFKMWL